MASRKRKALSLEEKLNVLHAVDKQPVRKRVDIAKDLGLPPSTLNSIVSKRAEIEENAALFGPKAKQARGAKYGNLDDALLTWFKQARAASINFDGSILREKAMEIADRLGITDFAASKGWIDHFPWSAVSASTAQHCFARCGFRMDGEEETAIEDEEPEAASSEEELNEAMNALGATGTTYDDYVAVDAAVVTSECQSIAQIVANSIASEAGDCDDDDEHKPQDSVQLPDPRLWRSRSRPWTSFAGHSTWHNSQTRTKESEHANFLQDTAGDQIGDTHVRLFARAASLL
ncbi:hypothetical protein MTO96_026197 [Rhipicephalus appendiculatus]